MAGACTHIDPVSTVIHPNASGLRGVREDRIADGCTCERVSRAASRSAATRRRTVTRPSTRTRRQHPVIASAEPGERWLYCYPDDAFAEY